MMYKITIKDMPQNNYAQAEIGMFIEISSKKLSYDFKCNPFKFGSNEDLRAVREAFNTKYGIDISNDGIINYSSDRYLKCEALG